MRQEIWRKVDGTAIQCTGCLNNHRKRVFEEDGDKPIGIDFECLKQKQGEDCSFLKKPVDNDKWYTNFRDVYKDEEEA